MLKKLKNYFREHPVSSKLVLAILLVAGFLRLFRVSELLWFNFDQGRDGLVIWDLIHHGKWFLIGPTTGIEGIFLGPFYYYLITPAYWLSGGNPAAAAGFVGLLTVLGIFFIYLIGREIVESVGVVAAFLAAISFNWVLTDRWLANPTPLVFFAPLTVWLLWKSLKNPSRFLWLAFFCLGLNLQLEASSSIFTLLAALVWVGISGIWKNYKACLMAGLAFFTTLLPQIGFELKHHFQITEHLLGFVKSGSKGEPSFAYPTKYLHETRLVFLFNSLMDKIEPDPSLVSLLLVCSSLVLIARKNIWENPLVRLLAIWFVVPLLLFFMYRGNQGLIFGYYLTPLVPIMFILISVGLWSVWNYRWGKIWVAFILLFFIFGQLTHLRSFLLDGLTGDSTIALGNQEKAIAFVYGDAKGQEFNTDFYVPPIIPYSYNYLFLWMGETKFGSQVSAHKTSLLYTIYENEENKFKINEWLDRQAKIGKIISSQSFGGVVVQKRVRIN